MLVVLGCATCTQDEEDDYNAEAALAEQEPIAQPTPARSQADDVSQTSQEDTKKKKKKKKKQTAATDSKVRPFPATIWAG